MPDRWLFDLGKVALGHLITQMPFHGQTQTDFFDNFDQEILLTLFKIAVVEKDLAKLAELREVF